MLNINIDIKGLDKLQKHIDFVNKLLGMKTDKEFQKFIQNKVLWVANYVTERLLVGGTTNDGYIDVYKVNHKIRETDNGFILYNDTKIPANAKDISKYPNGEFCLALAFEYGVGIVGQNTLNNENAWEYNINNYNFGWYYIPDGEEEYKQTAGYMGFGIYRNIAIEIENKLNDWVIEYYKKEVK